MKYLIFFLLTFTLATGAHARQYVFLPSPGHWSAHHTQYENKHVLYLDGKTYCKSDVDKPINPAQCDYWQAITWRKGKLDRNEALVMAVGFAFGLGDAIVTHNKIGQGCEEVGSFGLLGAHPNFPQLAGVNLLMQVPMFVASEHTPLSRSSAPEMVGFETVMARGSWRAMKKNLRVTCRI